MIARVAALACAVAIVACSVQPPLPGPFYDTAVPPHAKPGDLIRAEPVEANVPGGSAFRVIYASKGLDGGLRAVSGIIYVPAGTPPEGGRNVVAWAHPTTGVARRCAPSLNAHFADRVPGLARFIAAGDIVAATDYPGLGTVGPHPFLVGASEGRAVLDAVRAATHLPQAAAGTHFVVWGHSQGGHAALFAGALARRYAPDLQLEGVAVAAPASDLGVLMQDDIGTPIGRILTAYTLDAWSQVYAAPLGSVVQQAALPVVAEVAAACAEGLAEGIVLSEKAAPLKDGFLVGNPVKLPPWSTLMAANNAGHAAPDVPLMIAQGGKDAIVPAPATRALFAQLCRRRQRVHYLTMPDTGHMTAAKASADAVAAWVQDRFAGLTPTDDCADAEKFTAAF